MNQFNRVNQVKVTHIEIKCHRHLKDIEPLEPAWLSKIVSKVIVVKVQADQRVHHWPRHLIGDNIIIYSGSSSPSKI